MRRCLLLALACTSLPGCDRRPAARGGGWLREAAGEVGLDFTHSNGAAGRYQVPEIVGSGCAWIDFDLDGDLDAYLISAGGDADQARNRLFRNEVQAPGGRLRFVDVTATSGAGDTGFGMGCAVGDHDADGDPDLFVTNFGADLLYENLHGSGSGSAFRDVTASARVGDPRWSTGAAFADLDGDGDLDLFVANYMQHPRQAEERCEDGAGRIEYCGPHSRFAPERNTLYVNDGGGAFRDGTAAAGMGGVMAYGLGVVCGDFTGDGQVDIYVATDETPNQLWVGDGRGRFVDRGVELGAAFSSHGQAQAGMGVQAEDIDGDGATEIFVTNLGGELNAFYRGSRDAGFEDIIARTGMAAACLPVTGFGCGFLDADHDGDLDLLVTNGRVRRGARLEEKLPPPPWDLYAERDQLFEHVAPDVANPARPEGPWGFRFADRGAAEPALTRPHLGRGLALGDADLDGDVDALVTACAGKARLYLNEAPKRGHWLIVRPIESAGRGEVTGAVVTVTVSGRRWMRRADPAYSYLSSNDPRPHFGLGEATSADIEVRWPDGSVTARRGVTVDQVITIEKTETRKTP